MKTVLIAGATGLVGKSIIKLLLAEGWNVRILTRYPKMENDFFWNPSKLEMDKDALKGIDAVINLAGAGVADKRWSSERKSLITSSRVNGALTFYQYFKQLDQLPEVYVSAGAIGFYGNRHSDWLNEEEKSGTDFLSFSRIDWEKAVSQISTLGIRTVQWRIGIVLSNAGGAWPKLYSPLKLFRIAPVFGQGQNWYSWIHIKDLAALFKWALINSSVNGIYNAVSPDPIPQRELMKIMIKISKKWGILLPIPSIFLKIMMGEMSSVILSGSRVSPNKILNEGFSFQYPKIEDAVQDLINV